MRSSCHSVRPKPTKGRSAAPDGIFAEHRSAAKPATLADFGPMTASVPFPAMDQLSGLVERVTFHNTDTGFCVLRLKVRGERDLIDIGRVDAGLELQ